MMKTKIALADDHVLFMKSLILMLESFGNYEVILEASNGEELQKKIAQAKDLPDIVLLDINMPKKNGLETAVWITANYPDIKTVALTMNDNEETIIKMIRAGCCAYMLKDTHPTEFEKALAAIADKGGYTGDVFSTNFRRLLIAEKQMAEMVLTEKDLIFLEYVCTDLTYKQIADKMNYAERTIDGYREKLFLKFNVQSRVGLAMEAVRKGYVVIKG